MCVQFCVMRSSFDVLCVDIRVWVIVYLSLFVCLRCLFLLFFALFLLALCEL
jgi:hypothetical protein